MNINRDWKRVNTLCVTYSMFGAFGAGFRHRLEAGKTAGEEGDRLGDWENYEFLPQPAYLPS